MNGCPICGGRLKSKELKLYKNILHWRGGSVPLGPIHHAIMLMLKSNPGGITVSMIADRTGQSLGCTGVEIFYLGKKLKAIGWRVKNIGCGGRGNALYALSKMETVQ